MFRAHEYAVVDLETTGFSPAHHDRVVEVGVVRIDYRGRILSEYATLVNPKRDIGPTHVHGITAAEVLDALHFDQIAGDVLEPLKGAVLVAHNAAFDLRFLQSEFERCGIVMPSVLSLCTLSLSRALCRDLPSRRLEVLCDYFGIESSRAHSALEDARATAALLSRLFEDLLSVPSKIPMEQLGAKGSLCPVDAWPTIKPSGRRHVRTDARERRKKDEGLVQHLLARLPPSNTSNNAADEYLDLLAHVLEDRHITQQELEALGEMALDLDMDQEEVRQAHRRLMLDLTRSALLDGVVTDAERRDLEAVASLLDIASSECEALLDEAAASPVNDEPADRAGEREALVGKQVCFTGEFNTLLNGERVSRATMEAIAASHGMIVKKSVTKSLDMLVCADPDSMSGKARKARDYGIRIVAEPAFFGMIRG